MSVGSILVIVAIAFLAVLIFNSARQIDPADKACAEAIARLIKSGEPASPNQVAELFRDHGRTLEQAKTVARMVAPLLRNSGAHQDERLHGMQLVREGLVLFQQKTGTQDEP